MLYGRRALMGRTSRRELESQGALRRHAGVLHWGRSAHFSELVLLSSNLSIIIPDRLSVRLTTVSILLANLYNIDTGDTDDTQTYMRWWPQPWAPVAPGGAGPVPGAGQWKYQWPIRQCHGVPGAPAQLAILVMSALQPRALTCH